MPQRTQVVAYGSKCPSMRLGQKCVFCLNIQASVMGYTSCHAQDMSSAVCTGGKPPLPCRATALAADAAHQQPVGRSFAAPLVCTEDYILLSSKFFCAAALLWHGGRVPPNAVLYIYLVEKAQRD